ncbi:MAG: hypothetical protein RLZZ518_1226 [Actinomycetota bacterium]
MIGSRLELMVVGEVSVFMMYEVRTQTAQV